MNKVIVINRKDPSFFTSTIGILFLIISIFTLPYIYGIVSSLQLTVFAIIFVSIWFLGWIIGMLSVLFIVLFESYGVEQIIVDENILKVNKTINGIGIKKKYEIDKISNMELNPFFDPSFRNEKNRPNRYVKRGGKIEFHYNHKLRSLGHLIAIYESKEVLETLKNNENFKGKNFSK